MACSLHLTKRSSLYECGLRAAFLNQVGSPSLRVFTKHKTEIKMQKEVVKPEQTEQPSEKPGEPTVANETPQETEVEVEELENDSDE